MDVEGGDGSVLHTLLVSDHIILDLPQKFRTSNNIVGLGYPATGGSAPRNPHPDM